MTQQTPYHEDQETDNNTSSNTHFDDILGHYITRRDLIKKTASGTIALALAATVTGCASQGTSQGQQRSSHLPTTKRPEKLSFKPVAKNKLDLISVPDGYQVNVLYALGDSINPNYADWNDHNIPSGPSFQFRSGDCHDGIHFFGLNKKTKRLDDTFSEEGLLVMNHEYINPTFLHAKGPTKVNGHRPEDEVIRENNAHGVSVIHVKKNEITQHVEIIKNSVFNRRITTYTPMDFSGAAAGSPLLATLYSPKALKARGTHNNCGNGYTPWGTYLTTEENFIGYFQRSSTDDAKRQPHEIAALKRYGLKAGSSSKYEWDTAIGQIEPQDHYDRWKANAIAETAAKDYRNGPNTFGWMVEIDPFDIKHNPVKRTSLGRFAHEDSACRAVEGMPLAFYMGDDSRGEYIYKFVSQAKWDAKDTNAGYKAGDKYMDKGTLYVAKFNQDGSGQWIELSYGKNGLDQSNKTYPFSSQADIVTFARMAADSVGATKMDRPEWCSINPENGEIYVTLTNNSNRGKDYATDAANPRAYEDLYGEKKVQKGNVNGHVIRFKEQDDKTTALQFQWDIYLFGAEASMNPNINLSGLSDNNDFSSPDGMWFDSRGILWLQTDDSAYTDVTNCMMLAALPGYIGDGTVATTSNGQQTRVGAKVNDDNLRRFLVGPKEAEITGITMTPDNKAIFVNIQHPGEESESYDKPNSHWPASQNDISNTTARPRSATIVITRKDGGRIAD
ncbi:PhoX family phosphatase [Acinetobacter sp. B5B]|uniref:PhoX family protein n=1 Tax=Acinetobacter baretiae TaxID=2605383 RepID=UPI0018C293FF|nr:PhoX family phosphatase [Acinetobacter baretiae]MBF7683294.1 PhoX family phosphatase [Acinetobacter baretiae]MBF7684486.1 PhoX family phosphatase [Acinetobacter baretiae]